MKKICAPWIVFVLSCNSCGIFGEQPSTEGEAMRECRRARQINCSTQDEFPANGGTGIFRGHVKYEPQGFGTKYVKDCNDAIDDSHKSVIIGFDCSIRSHLLPNISGSIVPNADGELTCGSDKHTVFFNPVTTKMRVVNSGGTFNFDCSDNIESI